MSRERQLAEKRKATNTVSFDEDQLKSITSRIDALIRITVLGLPETVSDDDKVSVLSQMGFEPHEIASMTGLTANAVRIRLHRLRKKAKAEPEEDADELTASMTATLASKEDGKTQTTQPAGT
jgi:DNA-directed RNA polymerase specialized sigma24 family protein